MDYRMGPRKTFRIISRSTVSEGGGMKYIKISICVFVAVISLTSIVLGQGSSRAAVQGRVSNLFGSPLSDVSIEILNEDQSSRSQTRSDPKGDYKFDGLPAGKYTILARLQGFRQEKILFTFTQGAQELIDIGLEVGQLTDLPKIKVSGSVKNKSGVPIQAATITLVNAFNQRLNLQVRSDAKGQYEVNVDNLGQYIIYASKSGFKVNADAIVLRATLKRQQRTVDFLLTPFSLP